MVCVQLCDNHRQPTRESCCSRERLSVISGALRLANSLSALTIDKHACDVTSVVEYICKYKS